MTVTRYRKRPVEVDTVQWTGDNEADVQAFTGGASNFYALDTEDREGSDDPEATATVYDKLHSTWVLVYTGQHVVRGVKGEYYPIAEDVLAETYEPAGLSSAADRATLRDRIAEAIHADLLAHKVRRDQGLLGIVPRLADAVLSVLPAPVGRATEWRAAADHIEAMRGYPSVMVPEEAVEELRRVADEAQQTETQARGPLVRWYVERHDHDGWVPASSPTRPRERAVQNLNERSAEHPDREFRLARATTTYTVEPAAIEAQQPKEARP